MIAFGMSNTKVIQKKSHSIRLIQVKCQRNTKQYTWLHMIEEAQDTKCHINTRIAQSQRQLDLKYDSTNVQG